MTFSLIAYCQRTKRLGVAIASEFLSVGRHCDGAIRSNVGATLTLGSLDPYNNALAIRLLAQGFNPSAVLDQLRANDPNFESTQAAIVHYSGKTAVHTGRKLLGSSRHRLGNGYVALCNGLCGLAAFNELATSFESNVELELEDRLLNTLESARDIQKAEIQDEQQITRSVALIVFGRQSYSDIDLRVDFHDEPIGELRRLYDEYQPFAAYYIERGKNPRNALPQREFADMLYASKAKEGS